MNKIKYLNAFGNKKQLRKFSEGRNKISDLYLSEKYFFVPIAKKSKTFLDFGCAAGNFIKIIKKLTRIKKFTGLDVSEGMLTKAKFLYPDHDFKKYDGKKIILNQKYDLTYSFGTLIYCRNYQEIINNLISHSRKYINFDVRLVFDKTLTKKNLSYQIISKNPLIKFPYVIINFNEFIDFILKTTKCRYKINLFGYMHKVSKDVRSKYKEVLMLSVMIDKTKKFSFNFNIKKI